MENTSSYLSQDPDSSGSRPKSVTPQIIGWSLLFSLVFSGTGVYVLNALNPQLQPESVELESNSDEATLTLQDDQEATISAVEKVIPAVVSIIVSRDINSADEEVEPELRPVGGGTGFIVTPDGFVVTNKHVVSLKEASYTVVMDDGTEYEARVIDVDPFLDLAVIKIEAENLAIVTLGDSDQIQIGQTVLAIGNTVSNYPNSVTKGIISGVDRSIVAGDNFGGNPELLQDVIQTDAAVNPGNSGGPLVNLQGEVLGINTAIDRGAQSIGFAIPINEVKPVVESVMREGRIVRPILGVRYMMITEEVKKENQLTVDDGALVVRGELETELAVIPDGAADRAGIVENDIILEVNGQKIDLEHPLNREIQQYQPGSEIQIKVLHEGLENTLTVVLEEAE